MTSVAILCGGKSYEHEVSVISGIQIAEHIDRTKYSPYFIYLDKKNKAFLIKNFSTNKRDFLTNPRIPIDLVSRDGVLVIKQHSVFAKTITIDMCYLAFHGGSGEAGQIQGLLELYDVPFTGSSQEGSVLAMNKAITKEVLTRHGVPVLDWVAIRSQDYIQDKSGTIKEILDSLPLPLIIKPVHLGSSIGIVIVETEVELEQQLSIASRLDTELILEPALADFTEYNIAVRSTKGAIEFSPIEEPKRAGSVLSFSDKYSNGGKRGSKQSGGGMELLDRTIPAVISAELETQIKNYASKVYRACRLEGMLRIDFMYSDGQLYCTELNPIPGSLAFYLWEAQGDSFQAQITHDLEDALYRHLQQITVEPYQTDIVERFLA